jgi:glycosyltransferase involved in cell wall biosynthesis
VVGDIESLREWITPGVNGLLVDPRDSNALAEAILIAFRDQDLWQSAQAHNARLVAARADYRAVMPKAERFYKDLIGGGLLTA